MSDNKERVFDPKIHICKFGFELLDYATFNPLKYNIICDLYQRELTFEFVSKRHGDIVDLIGYKLSDEKMQSLLPLVRWSDFERYRNLPEGWEWEFENGYRDGWGYKFWCLSESGSPLLQIYLSCFFSEENLPAYEKLLEWLRDNYKHKSRLKRREMLW